MSDPAPPPPATRLHWSSRRVRSALLQLAFALLVAWFAYELFENARGNLANQRIASGFGFLDNTAGFGVSQALIPYAESDTYARVFLVGLLNTLLVAVLGIVVATGLGLLIGLARLSSNWLIGQLAAAYVEIVRNLPLLFQILFWYLAVLGGLPGPRQSIGLGLAPVLEWLASALSPMGGAWTDTLRALVSAFGPPVVYLNNRGLFLPRLVADNPGQWFAMAIFALLALVLFAWLARPRRRGRGADGTLHRWGLLAALALYAAVYVATTGRSSFSIEAPQLRGFNFEGGLRLRPEFVALLTALSVYTAAYIAEIVRAGILAVPSGQREAALSLGLPRGPLLRLIVIPQAMRLIVPLLTSQYVNLVKNSSLAIVIGYPDLVAVFAGTTLNQTGQAVEIIALTMAVYLFISLAMSALMNWYNARMRLKER